MNDHMRLLIMLATLCLLSMACRTETDVLSPTVSAPPSIATRAPTSTSPSPTSRPPIVSPAVADIDRNVKDLVAAQGPRPSDQEISKACDALREAGWEYLSIGMTDGRTMIIAASITAYASGDRLVNYCNSFPQTIVPIVVATPDIESTKRAIAVADQHQQDVELATRIATEAKQEAERYAAELDATRTTELAILEATRTAGATMAKATRVAEIAMLCQEWEPMVMAWIREGNYYDVSNPSTPFLPDLSVQLAHENCNIAFPYGLLAHTGGSGVQIGTGAGQLLPGIYEYQAPSGDNRVETIRCKVRLNQLETNETRIEMIEGQPFQITFDTHHNLVSVLNWNYGGCSGFLHRVGD